MDIFTFILVDYILKDDEERERLHLYWTPKNFPIR